MEGDGPAALAVLEHMVREAKALRRAAIHQEHWKEMQDAQQHDDEEDDDEEEAFDDIRVYAPRGGWAPALAPMPATSTQQKKYTAVEGAAIKRKESLEAVTRLGAAARHFLVGSQDCEPIFEDGESLSLVIKALLGRRETQPHAVALLRQVLPEAWPSETEESPSYLARSALLWESAVIGRVLVKEETGADAELRFRVAAKNPMGLMIFGKR